MFLEYVQKYLFKVVTIVLQIVILAMLIRFFVISPAQVNGQSMEDTLRDEDILLVNKAIFLMRKPERFEIINAVRPDNEVDIVKRVVGLPDEIITFQNKKAFIETRDGEKFELIEPYAKGFVETEFDTPISIVVPENHYFLLGDNRDFSVDSRDFGPVHRRNIQGEVFLVNKWPDWFNSGTE